MPLKPRASIPSKKEFKAPQMRLTVMSAISPVKWFAALFFERSSVIMARFVYNVTKAPIGWSLFRGHERVGGFVSKEAALEAAAASGANALREGHSIQINVPGSEPSDAERSRSWPEHWRTE